MANVLGGRQNSGLRRRSLFRPFLQFQPGHLLTQLDPKSCSSRIRVYLEPGFKRYEYGVKPGQTFLDKIAAEKPDIVPMMIVCRFVMGDEARKDGSATHAERARGGI